ncbi:hypothetical protein GX50_07135 [[Emmonsia] crescens]|uniref:Ipa protein n=1 Tax=[Emmonsia] crescens TaxID=73230 RepID=A0A2B7Z953_9EURO|nr:hypothetical protein GX50_07135 [Emmonsia crescens]
MDEVQPRVELLKELQQDLARKYQLHGVKIQDIWRSLGKRKRMEAVTAGAAKGEVLKTRKDRSMGNVYKVMPEWNLQDLTEPGSDHLLDLLEHRATTSLCEQYREGPKGALGDGESIMESMRVNNLRHINPFKYCFTMFMDDKSYGMSYQVSDLNAYRETMAALSPAVKAGACVPQSTGELVLERQTYLLQCLNIVVEDILDIGSTTRLKESVPKKPNDAGATALSKLSINCSTEKLSLEDLIAHAVDQASSLEEYVNLCRTEPTFLAHVANSWFFSRPELIPDERGRRLPVFSDKYISISVFQAMHDAVLGAAVWGYLHRLLQSFAEASDDKISRTLILQEVSNLCHFEYDRARKLLKRYVQISPAGGNYFKRVSGAYDDGIPRVTMQVQPEALMRENPQLHFILHLCKPEADLNRVTNWIKKLDDLQQSRPMELNNSGFDAFCDLAAIASFIQTFPTPLPLPRTNHKKGQRHTYVTKLKALRAEIDSLKTDIDLSASAVPIDNLLEPGMADATLNRLNQFIIDKTGSSLGFLYQDLGDDCLSELQNQCQERNNVEKEKQKENSPENVTTVPEPLPILSPIVETPGPALVVEQRRQKNKTRPPHSSIYSIDPKANVPTQPEAAEIPAPPITVKRSVFDIFSTLFSNSEARGSISWTAFRSAMTALNFSTKSGAGSAYTFSPPEGFGVRKSLTVHQPHQARIEGYRLLFLSSRLRRVYGWNLRSFEVAE